MDNHLEIYFKFPLIFLYRNRYCHISFLKSKKGSDDEQMFHGSLIIRLKKIVCVWVQVCKKEQKKERDREKETETDRETEKEVFEGGERRVVNKKYTSILKVQTLV